MSCKSPSSTRACCLKIRSVYSISIETGRDETLVMMGHWIWIVIFGRANPCAIDINADARPAENNSYDASVISSPRARLIVLLYEP
jgi:hypothetical protein